MSCELFLSVLLGLVCVLVVPTVAQPTGTRCPPAPGRSETCVCKTDKGIIDLTVLSNTDGTPRYIDMNHARAYTQFNFLWQI